MIKSHTLKAGAREVNGGKLVRRLDFLSIVEGIGADQRGSFSEAGFFWVTRSGVLLT